tara:strand:- start:2169 stop:2576 length:408 start_codon:yes stop_codon:yes gene_type:complete
MILDIKQMKLITGEELIAEIIDSVVDDQSMPYDALVIKNPFTIDVFRKNIYLRPYMLMGKRDQVHLLNMDHLSVIMDPNKILQALYKKTMDDYYDLHPETIPDDDDKDIFRYEDDTQMSDSSDGNIIRFDPNKMH